MGKIHKFPVQTQMNVYEDDFKSAFVNDKEWKKLKKDYLRFLKPSNFDKNYKQLKKLKF